MPCGKFFISLTIYKHEKLQCSGLPSLRCYGALWKFFAVKLVAFCLLLWFAYIHFGPGSGPTKHRS